MTIKLLYEASCERLRDTEANIESAQNTQRMFYGLYVTESFNLIHFHLTGHFLPSFLGIQGY